MVGTVVDTAALIVAEGWSNLLGIEGLSSWNGRGTISAAVIGDAAAVLIYLGAAGAIVMTVNVDYEAMVGLALLI